ncbi:MAG TPA: hypothetical protein VIU63_01685, partial [Nitrospira sp.]
NSVFNRVDRGNWVEGLTTYLANYYWHESVGDVSQARDQRRLFVRGYNLQVPPERDYAVAEFTRKRDERDNAIGYQKAAMVFHMLRQEIGEETFWLSLKQLVARYTERHADWIDVERIFSGTSGRDLRSFFAQWIEQAGAPSLSLARAAGRPLDDNAFQLDVTIAQSDRQFRLSIPLQIYMENGREETFPVRISEVQQTVSLRLPARPTHVSLDPDAMVMRRIGRRLLPPVLNHYVTDQPRTVTLAFSDSPAIPHPYRDLLKRIEGQDSQKPELERTIVRRAGVDGLLPREGSVLVLSDPESREAMRSVLSTHCGDRIRLREQGFMVDGTLYEGGGTALLASCHRKDLPESVMTVLYATTPQAASSVSRLLFFYGWNSFVVFRDGAVVTRGDWPVHDHAEEMEVQIDEAYPGR